MRKLVIFKKTSPKAALGWSFLLAMQFSSISFGSQCYINNLGQDVFQFNDGKRTVSVLGWSHWDQNTLDNLNIAYTEISDEFSKGASCNKLENIAKRAMLQESIYANSSKDLYRRLQQFSKTNSSFTIAIEEAEQDRLANEGREDRLLNTQNMSRVRDLLAHLEIKCSDQSNNLGAMKIAFLKPQNLFYLENLYRNNQVTLKGVDDSELLQKTLASTGKLREFRIEKEKHKYPYSVYKDLKELIENFINFSEIPSDQAILRTLNKLSDGSLKARTQSVLEELQILANLAHERDKQIVRNLQLIDGDVVLVIGRAHLLSLQFKLLKSCDEVRSSGS